VLKDLVKVLVTLLSKMYQQNATSTLTPNNTMSKLPNSLSRPYRIWAGMKARCNDKRNKNYGARGISYDPKWETFSGFWFDMANGYEDALTIDRIDNEGNYCKENCRWATYKEQMRNFSGNTHITHGGKTMILDDWARELGITKQSLIGRIKKYGTDNPATFSGKRTTRSGFNYLSKEVWSKIEQGIKNGKSQTELATEFNSRQFTISRHMKKVKAAEAARRMLLGE
jgi:hypothetical protein